MAVWKEKPGKPLQANAPKPQTFDELLDEKARLEGQIRERQAEEIPKLRQRVAALASSLGVTIAEMFNIKAHVTHHKEAKERKKRVVTIKYRDPVNPENTWTGIGKPKKWLQERIDQGEDKEDYRVDDGDEEHPVDAAHPGVPANGYIPKDG